MIAGSLFVPTIECPLTPRPGRGLRPAAGIDTVEVEAPAFRTSLATERETDVPRAVAKVAANPPNCCRRKEEEAGEAGSVVPPESLFGIVCTVALTVNALRFPEVHAALLHFFVQE